MVKDPYKVLGIDKDATPEQIKKAYRKKAKENHPDLHPDDPMANEKMNEINEAYDMLNNPEKYQQQTFNQNTNSGYYYQQNPYGNSQNSYQNPYGNGQNFHYYTFEDLFGFGGGFQARSPQVEPGDSSLMVEAINSLNRRDFRNAVNALNSIPAYERNARWYYIASLTSYYSGNRAQGVSMIRKAVELDPYNSEYQQILDGFTQSSSMNNMYGGRVRTFNVGGMFYFLFVFFILNWFIMPLLSMLFR